MNEKKKLVIGEALKENAKKLGYCDEQIIIVKEKKPLYEIRHMIADEPHIKKVLTPTFGALSTNFKEFDDFVGFCLSNRINIFVINPNMSLYEVDDDFEIIKNKISIAFKTRVLIETDFEHF